jgi:hypothetical protein
MMAGGAAVLIAVGSARAAERVDAAAPVDPRIADDVMHMLAKDGKACVTREDFLKFQESVFARIDRNGDGRVAATEFGDGELAGRGDGGG